MIKIYLLTGLLLISLHSVSNYNSTVCKVAIIPQNGEKKKVLEKKKPLIGFRASIFRVIAKETDKNPLQTASGKIIDTNLLDSGVLKWVAVSRNLHVRYGGKYNFGDKITLHNCGKFSNETYIVEDLMAEKWINKIDILISKYDTVNYFFKNIKIK